MPRSIAYAHHWNSACPYPRVTPVRGEDPRSRSQKPETLIPKHSVTLAPEIRNPNASARNHESGARWDFRVRVSGFGYRATCDGKGGLRESLHTGTENPKHGSGARRHFRVLGREFHARLLQDSSFHHRWPYNRNSETETRNPEPTLQNRNSGTLGIQPRVVDVTVQSHFGHPTRGCIPRPKTGNPCANCSNMKPGTWNLSWVSEPRTRNPEPETRNPKFQTPDHTR